MAVTSSDTHDKGRPSSWVAALDDMCVGTSEETPRLIIVAAGNVYDEEVWDNYPDGNTLQSVHNPVDETVIEELISSNFDENSIRVSVANRNEPSKIVTVLKYRTFLTAIDKHI